MGNVEPATTLDGDNVGGEAMSFASFFQALLISNLPFQTTLFPAP